MGAEGYEAEGLETITSFPVTSFHPPFGFLVVIDHECSRKPMVGKEVEGWGRRCHVPVMDVHDIKTLSLHEREPTEGREEAGATGPQRVSIKLYKIKCTNFYFTILKTYPLPPHFL